jgi:hypothetical protein
VLPKATTKSIFNKIQQKSNFNAWFALIAGIERKATKKKHFNAVIWF